MSIEYARTISVSQFTGLIRETGVALPLVWTDSTSSPGSAQFHIQIGDEAVVAWLDNHHLAGEMMLWGWKDGRQIVFNMKSENCDFSQAQRVLILATGFYEYTEPSDFQTTRRDRHFFTMRGEDWFWILGVANQSRFAMLTARSGPDIKPYHKRQLCILPPAAGIDWLTLARPQEYLLGPSPTGTFMVRTLREAAPAETARHQSL